MATTPDDLGPAATPEMAAFADAVQELCIMAAGGNHFAQMAVTAMSAELNRQLRKAWEVSRIPEIVNAARELQAGQS